MKKNAHHLGKVKNSTVHPVIRSVYIAMAVCLGVGALKKHKHEKLLEKLRLLLKFGLKIRISS
jgi:hypothetical protein